MVSAIPLALSCPLSVPTSIQASFNLKIKDYFVFVEEQEYMSMIPWLKNL
jgi:hypothetical protein